MVRKYMLLLVFLSSSCMIGMCGVICCPQPAHHPQSQHSIQAQLLPGEVSYVIIRCSALWCLFSWSFIAATRYSTAVCGHRAWCLDRWTCGHTSTQGAPVHITYWTILVLAVHRVAVLVDRLVGVCSVD